LEVVAEFSPEKGFDGGQDFLSLANPPKSGRFHRLSIIELGSSIPRLCP
jgi:hypothetical protein